MVKFWTKMPLSNYGQWFLTKKKVGTFAQKIAHSIFRGPKIKVGIFAMTTLNGNACSPHIWLRRKGKGNMRPSSLPFLRRMYDKCELWQWTIFYYSSEITTNHWVFLGMIGHLSLFDFVINHRLRKSKIFLI